MHFGLYLKNKGIISAEQLVSAIETQLSTLTRIGQLALEEGIMSPRDIFEVLRAQGESPGIRFGELAIEMGLMTRDDLMRLLMIQSDRKRPVEEILVNHGVLTKQQVKEEMAAFRRAAAGRRAASATPSRIIAMLRAQKSASKSADAATAV